MPVEIRERPILFSGEMVKAILDDRKSMTRRFLTGFKVARGVDFERDFPGVGSFAEANGVWRAYLKKFPGVSIGEVKCPYGVVGDRLWVRETWRVTGRYRGDVYEQCLEYRADHSHTSEFRDAEHWEQAKDWFMNRKNSGWGTPIHMPRWASRINLEITSIRVEQVQDIAPQDVFAEGVQVPCDKYGNLIQVSGKIIPANYVPDGFFAKDRKWSKEDNRLFVKSHFAALWDTINGQGSWASNPWCWVIGFKRVK